MSVAVATASWGKFYGREIPVSATRLASMPSPEPDPEAALIAAEEGPPKEPEDQDATIEEMRTIVRDFLPREEAFLLEAHFARGQSQDAIAERLGRVKQSVQYRVRRALERVRWVRTLKTWRRSAAEIRRDLAPLDPADVDFAVVLWANHWNQTRTACWFGSTQSMVRVEIAALHRKLATAIYHPTVAPYFEDLDRVLQAREWNMGVAQEQGPRAIKFPKFVRTRRGGR